jgi:hypothetical protein
MAKTAQATESKKGATQEFVPSEDAILRELRQREVRKNYQTSDKAKAQRKAYQQKRYAETKATRDQIERLKEADPEKYAELEAKAKAAAAAAKKK